MFRDLFLFTFALTALGCGSSDAKSSAQVCDPGRTEECACVGAGDLGAQTCDAEGKSWGACECPDGTSGSSSGSGAPSSHGGASGSSSVGGVGGSSGRPATGNTDPSVPPWTKDEQGNWNPNKGCLLAGALSSICPEDLSHTTFSGECGAPCVYSGEMDLWCCPQPIQR
jgi:hypothetical protein